jgi:hypothetical protein
VFEVAPNIGLQWLVEAAEELQAFVCDCLCDGHVGQMQLDERYAMLRAVKDGECSEDKALHVRHGPSLGVDSYRSWK